MLRKDIPTLILPDRATPSRGPHLHLVPDAVPPARPDVIQGDGRNACGLTFSHSCPEWPIIVRIVLWALRNPAV